MIKKFKFFKEGKNENPQYELINKQEFNEKVEEMRKEEYMAFNDNEKDSIKKILKNLHFNSKRNSLFFTVRRPNENCSGEIFKDIRNNDDWWYLMMVIFPPGEFPKMENYKYFRCDELTGLLNCLQDEVIQ